MTEENNKVITINDVDYTEDQLTDQQKVIINHIGDLDRKIRNTQFSLDQLTVGKEAFVKMLTDSLEAEETEEAAA
jgi:NADH/NAD ratio-sensing transcriptional regulator Rex